MRVGRAVSTANPPYAASTCSQIVLARHEIGERAKRIDRARVGGARVRHDIERHEPGGAVLGDGAREPSDAAAGTASSRRQQRARVRADAGDPRRADSGGVCLVGRVQR